jgi:putative membrane protein
MKHSAMMKSALLAVLASGMMCVAQDASSTQSGGSASSNTATAKGADSKFAMEAAQGGLAEVELAKVAQDKGSDPQVKQFAQKMIDDHSKANDDLKQIAQQENMTVPTDLSAKDQAEKTKLAAMSGPSFDRAYMKYMVMDHTKDANEFKKEANSGKDPAIKGFAAKYKPIIEQHLSMAKDMNSKMSGASKSSSNSKPSM